MKKLIFSICALMFLCGCSEPYWTLRYIPTTDEERKMVSEYVEKMISSTKCNNDLEHFIAKVQAMGCEMYCKPTLWEVCPTVQGYHWDYTGNWKYIENK